jgi:hypothetical protein
LEAAVEQGIIALCRTSKNGYGITKCRGVSVNWIGGELSSGFAPRNMFAYKERWASDINIPDRSTAPNQT